MIHTITADNGKEFARNKDIAGSLGIQFFFAMPYHSWERGANENRNGLARQYIPKGSDFDLYSEENIAEIEWKLNHRPRKSLLPSVRHCDAVALGNENLTENS